MMKLENVLGRTYAFHNDAGEASNPRCPRKNVNETTLLRKIKATIGLVLYEKFPLKHLNGRLTDTATENVNF